MAGYTHTCAACDAKLKIHERYVGRTLHCTECGTEFLADPTLVDIDDIIDELVPEKTSSVPWVWIVLAVVVLSVVGLVLGQASHSGWLAELFKPHRGAGQIAVVTLEGRDQVPGALDRESIVFIVDALEDSDPGSLDVLRAQGRLLDLPSGTKVKVIERARRDRIARVRILSGSWTSRVVWVPAVSLR